METSADTFAPIVVLTGASSGIGRATAWALAGQHARLVLVARDRSALDLVVAECNRLGASARAVAADVTDAASVTEAAQTAIDQFGHFDVWINNVGVGAVGPFDEAPIEAHRRVIESNLIGHMNGAHAAIKHFRQRQRGILINMISLGGWWSTPYAAAYTASKFGLRGFGQSLRAELADLPDVHVCDAYPALVDTAGITHGANYTGRKLKAMRPLLDPRTVASKIISLIRNPRPTLPIGTLAHAARYSQVLAPEVRGKVMRRFLDVAFSRADQASDTEGNLFRPARNHAVDGGHRRKLPRATMIGVAALSLTGLAWLGMRGLRATSAHTH
jgi:short-subunit dehydrogenase